MAFYCQNMLEIALILAEHDPMYEEIAFQFAEHFIWISYAMDRIGGAPGRDVGRGGRVLLRPAAAPDGRRAAEGAVDGRAAAAVRVHGVRGGRVDAVPKADGADRPVPEAPSQRSVATWLRPTRGSSATRAAAAVDPEHGRSWSECSRTCSTRTSSWAHGIRSLSRYHLDHPFVMGRWPGVHGQYLPANRTPGCSAATPTGGARSGCRSTRLITAPC